MSDEDCQVYMCVLTLFCVVICDDHFAFSDHHLDLSILLVLDFLSVCLDTRALRNTYLDDL